MYVCNVLELENTNILSYAYGPYIGIGTREVICYHFYWTHVFHSHRVRVCVHSVLYLRHVIKM